MMDFLLPALQLLFFLPVVVRVASESGGKAKGELQHPLRALRQPGIVIHSLGLLLVASTAMALIEGEVQRSVSVRAVLGASMIGLGAALLVWSLAVLKSWRFLPEIEKDHELCTSGPYAIVRNPNYLALDLLGVGSVLWVTTGPMALAAAMLLVGGDLRARVEERALVDAFGDRYRDYRRRVRRFIPGIY